MRPTIAHSVIPLFVIFSFIHCSYSVASENSINQESSIVVSSFTPAYGGLAHELKSGEPKPNTVVLRVHGDAEYKLDRIIIFHEKEPFDTLCCPDRTTQPEAQYSFTYEYEGVKEHSLLPVIELGGDKPKEYSFTFNLSPHPWVNEVVTVVAHFSTNTGVEGYLVLSEPIEEAQVLADLLGVDINFIIEEKDGFNIQQVVTPEGIQRGAQSQNDDSVTFRWLNRDIIYAPLQGMVDPLFPIFELSSRIYLNSIIMDSGILKDLLAMVDKYPTLIYDICAALPGDESRDFLIRQSIDNLSNPSNDLFLALSLRHLLINDVNIANMLRDRRLVESALAAYSLDTLLRALFINPTGDWQNTLLNLVPFEKEALFLLFLRRSELESTVLRQVQELARKELGNKNISRGALYFIVSEKQNLARVEQLLLESGYKSPIQRYFFESWKDEEEIIALLDSIDAKAKNAVLTQPDISKIRNMLSNTGLSVDHISRLINWVYDKNHSDTFKNKITLAERVIGFEALAKILDAKVYWSQLPERLYADENKQIFYYRQRVHLDTYFLRDLLLSKKSEVKEEYFPIENELEILWHQIELKGLEQDLIEIIKNLEFASRPAIRILAYSDSDESKKLLQSLLNDRYRGDAALYALAFRHMYQPNDNLSEGIIQLAKTSNHCSQSVGLAVRSLWIEPKGDWDQALLRLGLTENYCRADAWEALYANRSVISTEIKTKLIEQSRKILASSDIHHSLQYITRFALWTGIPKPWVESRIKYFKDYYEQNYEEYGANDPNGRIAQIISSANYYLSSWDRYNK